MLEDHSINFPKNSLSFAIAFSNLSSLEVAFQHVYTISSFLIAFQTEMKLVFANILFPVAIEHI